MKKTAQQRFSEKYTADHGSGCFVWAGCLINGGYGQFHPAPGKRVLAHRYAWELFHGPIPEGAAIGHTCGCHACVNPAHLVLLPGKAHKRRLDAATRRKLRKAKSRGLSYAAIARRSGLPYGTVYAAR